LGSKNWGLEFKVWVSESGFRSRVESLGFGVQGIGFRVMVKGLGFRV
jgi:hypothetical protein